MGGGAPCSATNLYKLHQGRHNRYAGTASTQNQLCECHLVIVLKPVEPVRTFTMLKLVEGSTVGLVGMMNMTRDVPLFRWLCRACCISLTVHNSISPTNFQAIIQNSKKFLANLIYKIVIPRDMSG